MPPARDGPRFDDARVRQHAARSGSAPGEGASRWREPGLVHLLERCIWHRRRACGSHQQRAGGRGGVRGAMRSQQLVRRMAKRSAPTTDTVIPRAGGRGGIRGEAE